MLLSEKDLETWISKAKKAKIVSIDTETTGLDYMDSELVGVSLAIEPGKAAYIPVGHTNEGQEEQLPKELVLKKLKPFLESKTIKFIGQNIKFDRNILAQNGIDIDSIFNDTMLMSYVLNSTATRHNLDALAQKYLNFKTTTFEDVAGKGVKQISFNNVDIRIASEYASEDADITLRLFLKLEKLLKKNQV